MGNNSISPKNITDNLQSHIDNQDLFFLQNKRNDIFMTALKNSNVFIFETDSELRYIKAANSELLFGDKCIIGLTDHDLFSPETARKLSENKIFLLNSGQPLNYQETLIIDSKTFYLEVKLELIKDVNEKISGICGIMVDITREKLSEIKLKKTIKALDRYIKELEQLSYVASHDLQEPLRAIGSFTQLLELRYKDRLDDTANKYIYYAVDGVNKMKSLLNNLLFYTTFSKIVKPFEICDCNIIVNKALNSLNEQITKTNAVIISDDLPEVFGDENQLILLFQHLIENAIKFSKDRIPEVEIKSEKLEFEWLFSIKDDGAGIEKEYHKKIFTIFQRLNNRDEFEGTGIGLALCKKIIEHHGGQIWVDSELNKGSTFYFTIPFKGD